MMVRPNKGVALMIVLVLLAAMASVAVSLSSSLQSQVMLAQMQQDYQQALWYATGAESLALNTLSRRHERLYFGKNGGLEYVRYPVEQGSIQLSLSDLQACFNVNVLATPEVTSDSTFREQLVNLFTLLGVPAFGAGSLAEQIQIKVNGKMTSLPGSVVGDLSGMDFLMADISELRQFKGMDAALYQKVTPFLCTLPTTKLAINMNTLSPEKSVLLAALFFPFLNAEQARSVLLKRPVKGWDSVDHFLEALPASVNTQKIQRIKAFLQVESNYLQLNTLVHMNTLNVNMQSLITRKGKDIWAITWHQIGELQ
ncbi:TPA: type II secretion system minor pseudopilin GspK [Salmonella enterica subsp. enterica serovar Virchow]